MAFETEDVSGVWWRNVPGEGQVHYRATTPADFRWQRGSVVEGLYFADSEDTMWAEFYGFVAEAGFAPDDMLPRDVWQWQIDVDDVADLRTPAQLAAQGLPIPGPDKSTWPSCQAVGERAWADGHPGLLAPSARRPEDGVVLCLFRTAVHVDGATPLPPPRRQDTMPQVPRGLRT